MEKKYSTGFLLFLLACAGDAVAADGTFHMSGDVTESTCNVDVAGTNANYGTVDFGSVTRSMVFTNGAIDSAVSIGSAYILFQNCAVGTQYTVTLDGLPTSDGNPNGIKNSVAGGANPTLELRYVSPENSSYLKFVRGQATPVYVVDNNSRSMKLEPYLYLNYLSTLTYGPIRYDVSYTVNFL